MQLGRYVAGGATEPILDTDRGSYRKHFSTCTMRLIVRRVPEAPVAKQNACQM